MTRGTARLPEVGIPAQVTVVSDLLVRIEARPDPGSSPA